MSFVYVLAAGFNRHWAMINEANRIILNSIILSLLSCLNSLLQVWQRNPLFKTILTKLGLQISRKKKINAAFEANTKHT